MAQPNYASPYATSLTRIGKTLAMQGVKFEIADEGGVYVDVTDYAAAGTYRSSAPVSYHSAGRRRDA